MPKFIASSPYPVGVAACAIIGFGGEWRIRHDGKFENVYQTEESAFEAAVATAFLALKRGSDQRTG